MWWVLGTVAYLFIGAALVGVAWTPGTEPRIGGMALVMVAWPLIAVMALVVALREPR